MWILGHDFSGHYNRLALISVAIISGVYCILARRAMHPPPAQEMALYHYTTPMEPDNRRPAFTSTFLDMEMFTSEQHSCHNYHTYNKRVVTEYSAPRLNGPRLNGHPA